MSGQNNGSSDWGGKNTHLSYLKYKYIKIHKENRQKADTLVDQTLNLQHQHTPFCIQKSANRGRHCVWSHQHLVNYLALFILPEMEHHMSVSSTLGYNEHIWTAQNACKDLFLQVSISFFLFRSLINQMSTFAVLTHAQTQCLYGQSQLGIMCKRMCPLFCNACFCIVTLLLGLQDYLHNVREYSIKPVIL